jgi:hypothetical protein
MSNTPFAHGKPSLICGWQTRWSFPKHIEHELGSGWHYHRFLSAGRCPTANPAERHMRGWDARCSKPVAALSQSRAALRDVARLDAGRRMGPLHVQRSGWLKVMMI